MHLACCLSSKFVVIAFEKGFDQMIDLRIKRLGLSERGLPTVIIDADFKQVSQGFTEDNVLMDLFTQAAHRAIEQGAEAIIPGQLYLSEAIAHAKITRIEDVPIIDGLSANLKMAEIMHDLKSLGISTTRRGYVHARPPADMIEHARKFQGREGIDKSTSTKQRT
jgi:Asp/Glu/hydantoin racemase